MESSRVPNADFTAFDEARQVNFGGSNFGPVYMAQYAAARRLPHELPLAVSDFTGRNSDVSLMREWLAVGAYPRLVNVYGIPGSGKSTLAIHVCQQLADQFPDCQLYFNLRDIERRQTISPGDLLGNALRALGIPLSEMPSELMLRATAFRSALAELRTIIVIDNASDATQLEYLLPGMGEAIVIITSYGPISELPGVRLIPLGPLEDADAVAMLQTVSQRQVNDEDLPTVQKIARMAGNLPLALRIAAGLLKGSTYLSWETLLARLGNPDDPSLLDRFRDGQLAVRAAFELAYADLGESVARGFRMLGLAPAPAMSPDLARLLISAEPEESDQIFDQLARRQLVHVDVGVVRIHDLLWLNARELVARDDAQMREDAVGRMIAWSLHLLASKYLPHLRLALNLVPALGGPSSAAISLSKVYVETAVTDDRPDTQATRLEDIFPDIKNKVMLIGSGGVGKTTIVSHLCDEAARRHAVDGHYPIPLLAPVREILFDDQENSLDAFILRLLRYRYDTSLPVEALQVAFSQGRVLLVLDGLDEVVEPSARQKLVESVHQFSRDYPDVPMLVSSRPYIGLSSDFVEFEKVHVKGWNTAESYQYLAKLAEALGLAFDKVAFSEIFEGYRTTGPADIMNTPLGLQILLMIFSQRQSVPYSPYDLMDAYISLIVFRRETRRGTLYLEPHVLMEFLERVAFIMQSSVSERVLIGAGAVMHIAAQVDGRPAKEFLRALNSRLTIFQETASRPNGETLFSFTHTAFREFFASRHLAQLSPEEFVEATVPNLTDASWDAVVAYALEVRARERSFREYASAVTEVASRRGNPEVVSAITAWIGRATKPPRGR